MKGFIGMLVWLLASIGALNWGLVALKKGLFEMAPFVTRPEVVYWTEIAIGIAGLISLVLFFGSLFHKHSCECCKK